MALKPPKIDGRRFEQLVREMEQRAGGYLPEWRNKEVGDPGAALLRVFSQLQETLIDRLDKVPDKHYVEFLRFIGEKQQPAVPSMVPLTFSSVGVDAVEIEAQSLCSTRQTAEVPSLRFLTVEPLSVHSAQLTHLITVQGGEEPQVAEQNIESVSASVVALKPRVVPAFQAQQSKVSDSKKVSGVDVMNMDPLLDGPKGYTHEQYLYITHPNFDKSDAEGKILIQTAEGMSLLDIFSWFVQAEDSLDEVDLVEIEDEQGALKSALELDWSGLKPSKLPVSNAPSSVQGEHIWLIGKLNYDSWLAKVFREDLSIVWRDDRGGSEQEIFDWSIKQKDNSLLWSFEDIPPIQTGWSIQLQFVDRGFPAGHSRYLPIYEWSYRTIDGWVVIPSNQIRIQKSRITILGPLSGMVSSGDQIRAERLEAVSIKRLCPDLEVELIWSRPITTTCFQGERENQMQNLPAAEMQWTPFQLAPTLPPSIGTAMYVASDLLCNERQDEVLLNMEYSFSMNGDPIDEPEDLYAMRLLYRAEDSWRTVWDEEHIFARFTLRQLRVHSEMMTRLESGAVEGMYKEDIIAEIEESFKELAEEKDKANPTAQKKYKLSLALDPDLNLKGIIAHKLEEQTTGWLKIELIKANLTSVDEEKNQHPIQVAIHDVDIRIKADPQERYFKETLLAPLVAQINNRPNNRRFTQIYTRANKVEVFYPELSFIDVDAEQSFVYLGFDQIVPVGSRHSVIFRLDGEQYMDHLMVWEQLEEGSGGEFYWRRLSNQNGYAFNRTGPLYFATLDTPKSTRLGYWIRGRFDSKVSCLPRLTHIMLNTVDAVNLHRHRTERYSGNGQAGQEIDLLQSSVFSPDPEKDHRAFVELWNSIRVLVEEGDEWELWTMVSEFDLACASKDERVFALDTVDGKLVFGNGVNGRMLPYGSNNVLVDMYYEVPGAKGNVGIETVVNCDFSPSLVVKNYFPAIGGRNAEQMEDVLDREPMLLTTRDRAVTFADFEILAKNASDEVARVMCVIVQGQLEIVVLPRYALLRSSQGLIGLKKKQKEQQVEEERYKEPDLTMALGLRDHVSRYLKKRCLISLDFDVRLVRLLPIDLQIHLRLSKGAPIVETTEQAENWFRRFLDPYEGGISNTGWPFKGTLYEEDLHRVTIDIPDVRHLIGASIYPVRKNRVRPGWEEGMGQSELQLTKHDLFWLRFLRVVITEER